MEPTLPAPHGSPEIGPILPRPPEQLPQFGQEIPRGPEVPAPAEKQPGVSAGAPPPPPVPVIPLPAPVQPQQQSSPVQDSTNPAVAADEDLIEKEWVEKAKRVISETKHDPHAQERAVNQLQADYLNKRYGKVLKLPKED